MLSPIATVVYKHFEEITDPRLNRGLNHDLGEMMFVALTAALAGADSWADVEPNASEPPTRTGSPNISPSKTASVRSI